VNGLLTVDIGCATISITATKVATSDSVAKHMINTLRKSLARGITNLTIVLDNNTNHRQKMKAKVYRWLKKQPTQLELTFLHTSPYSPKINLAEYLIHLLRLKVLTRLPVGLSIQQVTYRIHRYLKKHQYQLMSPTQIFNTLRHIYASVPEVVELSNL
jgi:hypothetical protein